MITLHTKSASVFVLAFVSSLLMAPLSIAATTMHEPTSAQSEVLSQTLGSDFVTGDGSDGLVDLLEFDLNGDGTPDLIATQRSRCGLHECTYEILLSRDGSFYWVSTIGSWADLKIGSNAHHGVRDLIGYDLTRIVNECVSCSPLQPERFIWNEKALSPKGTKGSYMYEGPIKESE
jgi:hypothetical protein